MRIQACIAVFFIIIGAVAAYEKLPAQLELNELKVGMKVVDSSDPERILTIEALAPGKSIELLSVEGHEVVVANWSQLYWKFQLFRATSKADVAYYYTTKVGPGEIRCSAKKSDGLWNRTIWVFTVDATDGGSRYHIGSEGTRNPSGKTDFGSWGCYLSIDAFKKLLKSVTVAKASAEAAAQLKKDLNSSERLETMDGYWRKQYGVGVTAWAQSNGGHGVDLSFFRYTGDPDPDRCRFQGAQIDDLIEFMQYQARSPVNFDPERIEYHKTALWVEEHFSYEKVREWKAPWASKMR